MGMLFFLQKGHEFSLLLKKRKSLLFRKVSKNNQCDKNVLYFVHKQIRYQNHLFYLDKQNNHSLLLEY
jgi:hypothetical protein